MNNEGLISGIVLAAGLSRRMGEENKLLMPYKGKPLFLHALEAVLSAGFEEVILVLGHEAEEVESQVLNLDVKTIFNPDYSSGMTSSIQVGVKCLSEETEGFFICLSDMPFITSWHIRKLMSRIEMGRKEILVPYFNKKRSHPVFFSKHFKEEILHCEHPDGCREVIKNNLSFVKEIHFKEDVSFDVDTQEDYRDLP